MVQSNTNRTKEEILVAVKNCEIPRLRGNGKKIRDYVVESPTESGWSSKVRIDRNSKISIASQKNKTGLGIQTSGNMARMYADLMKLQKLYIDGSLTCGVLILPRMLHVLLEITWQILIVCNQS